jgi:hypothetical protein
MICQLSQESPDLCVGGFGSAIHRHRTIVLGQMPPYFGATLIDAMVIGSTPMGLEVGLAQCNGWAGPALDANTKGTAMTDKCQWCGNIHGQRCPEVRAIEYHPDGTIKRVEFVTPGDRHPPRIDYSTPSHPRELTDAEEERIARNYMRRISS